MHKHRRQQEKYFLIICRQRTAVSQIAQCIPEVRTVAIDEMRAVHHLRQRVTPDEHIG